MEKTDRIIKLIREMMAVGAGGFTGSSAAEGPTAGYDPLIKFQRRGKTDYRKVPKTYKQWVKSLDSKNVRSRKTSGS
jgi:hypothetical protein